MIDETPVQQTKPDWDYVLKLMQVASLAMANRAIKQDYQTIARTADEELWGYWDVTVSPNHN